MAEPSLVSFLEQCGGTKLYVPKTLGLERTTVRSCPLEALVSWTHKKSLRENFGGRTVSVPMGKNYLAECYRKAGLESREIAQKLRISIRRVRDLAAASSGADSLSHEVSK
ncbi:hypothetical protein [Gluconobacter oxydans]|uniref:hypothetical protein n=1 Tax=Gluconobacter oxydans TaxID=442 RepID=UPI00346447E0